MVTIKKGIDLPLAGPPKNEIDGVKTSRKVALLGTDYVGMKPSMLVKVGDRVIKGQPLFFCKKTEGVQYTSPATGIVKEVNRGAKRVFQSLIIEKDGTDEQVEFKAKLTKPASSYSRDEIVALLVESGLWTSLRRRPYSKTPSPKELPAAIFITAMDSNPLSFDLELLVRNNSDLVEDGLKVISKLTDGSVYFCVSDKFKTNLKLDSKIVVKKFGGIHPAGNVGTHIHFTESVYNGKIVWYLGVQDVMAIAKLFDKGELDLSRYISIGGPKAINPRIIRTEIGAHVDEILEGEYQQENARVISGSVFNGHKASGAFAYVGRYHQQLSIIDEGFERELWGWATPGISKFSTTNVFISSLLPKSLRKISTALYGSVRDMVPIGTYEKVMPLDILPTQLLRSLLTKDTDQAQALGVLELDEEDLALCTFVDPGKVDYGPYLRETLNTIEKEG